MAISSLALRTTTFTATTTATIEWRTPATVRAKVLEISFIQLTAIASQIGVGWPQAIGVTPVNVLFQKDDPGRSRISDERFVVLGHKSDCPTDLSSQMERDPCQCRCCLDLPSGIGDSNFILTCYLEYCYNCRI